jgi:hypothetical protein
MREPYGMGL